jgi:hypothetical protein
MMRRVLIAGRLSRGGGCKEEAGRRQQADRPRDKTQLLPMISGQRSPQLSQSLLLHVFPDVQLRAGRAERLCMNE